MKYESSDPDAGITAMRQVDYSKAQIDIDRLMEPLTLQTAESTAAKSKRDEEDVELSV
jgi:hypothetical protein